MESRSYTNLGFEEKLFNLATAKEIAKSDFVLTPGRYCSSEAVEDDGEEFAVKFARLRKALDE